jgi:hypothetical protein
MHFHPFTADGARHDPLQFAAVQRPGSRIRTPIPRPALAHNGGKCLPWQQDAVAIAAVLDTVLVHQPLLQRHAALRARMLRSAAECNDAIQVTAGIGQRVLRSAVSAAQPAMQHVAVERTPAVRARDRSSSGRGPHWSRHLVFEFDPIRSKA